MTWNLFVAVASTAFAIATVVAITRPHWNTWPMVRSPSTALRTAYAVGASFVSVLSWLVVLFGADSS